ncbi:retinol dehydrogenase 7-like [Anguilla rostrata]|uniref:retinol dehydrogenase 7-like n=1 Tax=Anguilla rostrata TaxID=7938 RepID=UPI0030CD4ADC
MHTHVHTHQAYTCKDTHTHTHRLKIIMYCLPALKDKALSWAVTASQERAVAEGGGRAEAHSHRTKVESGPHSASMEDLCQYLLVALPVVCFLVWLWRDSQRVPNITEKYVLVTGCDSGFGNLLCKRLDRRGFRVLAACMTERGADDVRRAAGPNLRTALLDVTDSASIQKALEWATKEVGDTGLWGLVNNAGRSLPMGPTEWMKPSDFESTLRVNMTGVIAMTLAFLPLLKKGRGRVVNVASVLGRVAANGGGYCISKFAVESFSDCLRRDIHYFGVKVCIIEPGFFKTAVTNLESLERELHRLWNQLTPEVRDSYGEKYLLNCEHTAALLPAVSSKGRGSRLTRNGPAREQVFVLAQHYDT